jgi:hypothetical protein
MQRVRGLRAFLKLDALGSGALGVLLAATGGLLADPLGLPTGLLVPAGVFLVPYAGWLWYLATRPTVSPAAARVVVTGNLLWIVASVTLVAAGWFSPTALGIGFVLVQAAAVAGFVAGQYAGLRRVGAGVA